MLDWQRIDSVFLDMDGTLLDLYFDNYFWRQYVPQRYAEARGMGLDAAHADLGQRYQRHLGTLQWYCVDFWSGELQLDIAALKHEVQHLIAVHPHVPAFLQAARAEGKRVTLVTNAHHKSLTLKMQRTGLDVHFDALITSHQIGLAKEHPAFWGKLQAVEAFDPARTVLVDDSLPVLRSAQAYGIAQLVAVYQPDTREARKDMEEFQGIDSFLQIMPG
ncbi:MAG TPA: GMP/IMP nucleotidase [Betaproteobacteria bacterium]|nr:GMP/IMP nucleotidase [Betaproteobacteria bacterium]